MQIGARNQRLQKQGTIYQCKSYMHIRYSGQTFAYILRMPDYNYREISIRYNEGHEIYPINFSIIVHFLEHFSTHYIQQKFVWMFLSCFSYNIMKEFKVFLKSVPLRTRCPIIITDAFGLT